MLDKLVKTNNVRSRRRVGRGIGSKAGGHTATRGQKGQKSRSGYTSPRPGFEGGQMPLSRRIPKFRGYRRAFFKDKFQDRTFSVDELETMLKSEKIGNFSEERLQSYLIKYLGIDLSHAHTQVKVVGSKSKSYKPSKKVQSTLKLLADNGAEFSKSVSELVG